MALSAELNVRNLLQIAVDACRQYSDAEFGAFFYTEPGADVYSLYVLSGADYKDFASFPPVRKTPMFAPTFVDKKVVRIGNILRDPRHGQNGPHAGLPPGHLRVTSYMAVPVVSRTGDTFGAILLGHHEADVFTEKAERIVTTIAAQAAIALDNARLHEQAKEAIRLRDDFLSIAAHEIRNPLTPLKLRLQYLEKEARKRFSPDGNAIKSLEVCSRQVKRLQDLVEELMDVTRIRTGKLTLEYSHFDVVDMVHDLVERYRPEAEHSGCELSCPTKEEIYGDWDLARLQQVLINLITNAVKYAPMSPITVLLQKHNDEVIIHVMDCGPGIANEDQQRIFERFDRSNAAHKRGGLGLGLYIGRQIVEAHGGVITVESEPGCGTCFTVMLPLKPEEGVHVAKEIAFS